MAERKLWEFRAVDFDDEVVAIAPSDYLFAGTEQEAFQEGDRLCDEWESKHDEFIANLEVVSHGPVRENTDG